MKANELMLEDWVLYENTPKRILEIREEECLISISPNAYRLVHIDELFPIAITPEILNKNGFVFHDFVFGDYWECYGLHIYGGNYADGHSNWNINCGTNVSMNVTYIHQLQHAFKLCGIEDEIQL
ncbi:MAG: hypothetical protein IJ776_09585 [Paludibacteraceae bacterium]|nr:hypothetical protein [Paludibacteraceae bacterium]